MASAAAMPIRAHHVGSLIRPPELIKARDAAGENAIGETERRRIQEAAIRDVVRLQEDLGYRLVTDGEYNRNRWQADFLLKFSNVALIPSKVPVKFHSAAGVREHRPPTLEIRGRLARPKPIFLDDFKFLKSVAREEAKITIPSPSMLHFRGGRELIDRQAYPELAEFYDDVARVYREEIDDYVAAGCRFVQIDEVNLAYLCDPELREHARSVGEDPDALPATYAKLLNKTVAGLPRDVTIAMHLCRGNFAGAWIAEGGYDPIAELLFNGINIGTYYLEYDSERAGGFEPLRFLPRGKIAVLGLITTKAGALESKDALKRRIDDAARFAPIEQLALSPQCGFSSGVGGNAMTVEEEIAKLRLVIEIAQEVWGSA
ncbi:MAG TPA: 5-methyltetrahydropteroyltriglutamate--homocysteine S-methyltransferase [Alphaproteobacteria bacterium]|jgi:5-methyltetrahydropteroyltriglutamate--homocysteine methyltransferase|nr:5-methyltetrahydropteroyltriglutamate--homocysteine S-methyltransferase [Alphaproteobacteria bacterium]